MTFTPPKSARVLAAAVASTLAVSACDSVAPTDPAVIAIAGNYVLRSINDTLLPYTVQTSATAHDDIVADTLNLGLNGVFLDRSFFRHVVTGSTDTFDSQALDGYLAVSGSTVNFLVNGAIVVSGTINGTTLTLTGNGNTSVYTK